MEIQSVSLRGRKTAALWTDTSLKVLPPAWSAVDEGEALEMGD
jgi:hypothetical protein